MHRLIRGVPAASPDAMRDGRAPSAQGRSTAPTAAARDLLAYVLPLSAVLVVLAGQLVGGRTGPDAALLLLLLVVAVTGWVAGEGPTIVVALAAILAGIVLAIRPTIPVPVDAGGDLVVFVATAVITAAIAIGFRRRDSAGRLAGARRLAETEHAREEAESRATRLTRLQHLTESVARQLEPREMAARVLEHAIRDVGATAGVLVGVDRGTPDARIMASVGFPRGPMERWEAFRIEEGLPVTEAIRLRRPLVFTDTAELRERFPILAAAIGGLGSGAVVPLPYEDRIVGALYLRYPDVRTLPAEEISFLMAVAAIGAAAIERSRLYAAERAARESAERAAARLRFLADAGEILGSSLDLDTTLHRLTGIAVPRVADWCAVRLASSGGELTLAAIAHADPDRLSAARRLVAMQPVRLSDPSGAGAVARSGRREVVPDVGSLPEPAPGVDPGAWEVLRELDLRTIVNVPLPGRSRTLGVLTLAWSLEPHPLDEDELALADELASRAATAIDNARLHGDLEAHALRLQAWTAEQAAVARLGQRALGRGGLQDLLRDALQTVHDLTGSDLAMLVRRLEHREASRVVAALGWDDSIVGDEAPLGATDGGVAIASGAAVRIDDLRHEERLGAAPGSRSDGVVAGLAVPIAGADAAWGAIALHRRSPRPYDVDDENFVGAVTNVLAAALERTRHERELAARDERLELTLASSRTGTWEWDAGSGRIGLSDEACTLYGLPRGTSVADLDALAALAHPDDRAALRTAILDAVRAGTGFEVEYRIPQPDGSVRWTNGVGRVFTERGVAQRLLGIVRDISDLKAAEAEQEHRLEAEREARLVGRAFIGVVSHELRTPITSIYAGSKLLQRGHAAAERREEIARDVEAEAERLYRLTEDLLVLTRLERGDLRIGGEPVLLGHVVRRVVASEEARWPRVRFHVRERGATEPALGEEVYVEQVVRNLLSNAAKYSLPGSRVDIVIAADDGAVSVRVLDRGPGVGTDPDQLFELFYRAPQTASQASGAGIGLFVCKRLVEAMQGRLWARSRRGGGSEFGFELERYDEAAALEEPADDGAEEGATASVAAVPSEAVASAIARPATPSPEPTAIHEPRDARARAEAEGRAPIAPRDGTLVDSDGRIPSRPQDARGAAAR